MTTSTLENLLKERIGLDPEVAGRLFLRRAVLARLKSLGWGDDEFDRYERTIAADEAELRALIEEVVVSESWFFRDEIPFAYLGNLAAAGWSALPERPLLRILSIPCSRGEEPYSIAITLRESGLAPDRFRIDAVDISRNAIDQAKIGYYPENAFRTKTLDFRGRYFRDKGQGFLLNDEIRSLVNFHQGNVLDFLNHERQYDIIFCRNLLIYFDATARVKAIESLLDSLDANGVLFVGHAEGLGVLGMRFRSVGGRGAFAFQRVAHVKGEEPSGESSRIEPFRPVAFARLPLPVKTIPSQAIPTLGRPEPPPLPIEPPLKTLAEAQALADQGKNLEAAAICQELISRRSSSTETHYLLGLVRQALGDRLEAERCYERVVYLDAHHEEALLALARMAEGRGDRKASENFRRRAGRARKENSA